MSWIQEEFKRQQKFAELERGAQEHAFAAQKAVCQRSLRAWQSLVKAVENDVKEFNQLSEDPVELQTTDTRIEVKMSGGQSILELELRFKDGEVDYMVPDVPNRKGLKPHIGVIRVRPTIRDTDFKFCRQEQMVSIDMDSAAASEFLLKQVLFPRSNS